MTDLSAIARECLETANPLQAFTIKLRSKSALLNECAQFYLDHVRQSSPATHSASAGVIDSGQVSPATQAPNAGNAPGQIAAAIQTSRVRGKNKREWKAPPQRSPEMRANERAALRDLFDNYRIDRRPIGNFRWRELDALTRENARNAAGLLDRGIQQTTHAVLCRKLKQYTKPTDDNKLVRDVVTEKVLDALIREAQVEARQLIAYGVQTQASVIEDPSRIIPAAS